MAENIHSNKLTTFKPGEVDVKYYASLTYPLSEEERVVEVVECNLANVDFFRVGDEKRIFEAAVQFFEVKTCNIELDGKQETLTSGRKPVGQKIWIGRELTKQEVWAMKDVYSVPYHKGGVFTWEYGAAKLALEMHKNPSLRAVITTTNILRAVQEGEEIKTNEEIIALLENKDKDKENQASAEVI